MTLLLIKSQYKEKMPLEIPKNEVLNRIRFENPWWISGKIDDDFAAMTPRPYIELFKSLIESDVRRAVVLSGPRRVGKTVMLHHTIRHLLLQGVDPKKILFLTVESPVYNNLSLEKLFDYAKEAAGVENDSGFYVFYDEIQYSKNWELSLKTLVDGYRKDRFAASGSAAAALLRGSTESGAGRFTNFMLPPLTFYEYISLLNLDRLVKSTRIDWEGNSCDWYETSDLKEFNRRFIDYVNFGGYPEAVFSESVRSNPGRFIRQDVIDKVLLRDLPCLYGIKDTTELNSFFTTITYNTGSEFSYEKLSKSSRISKNSIKKYVEYLEAAFLIKKVRRIDQSGKRLKRDNFFKIYLTNPSLRCALFAPATATDEMIGSIVETAIFSQWAHRLSFEPMYARWHGGEVDLVGLGEKNLQSRWAVEVKWSNRFFESPEKLKSLVKFCSENNLKNSVATTIDKTGAKTVGDLTINFIPSAVFAYNLGFNSSRLNRDRLGSSLLFIPIFRQYS